MAFDLAKKGFTEDLLYFLTLDSAEIDTNRYCVFLVMQETCSEFTKTFHQSFSKFCDRNCEKLRIFKLLLI